jgi:hypothetical protein
MITICLLFLLVVFSQSGPNAPHVIQDGVAKSIEERLDEMIHDLEPLNKDSTEIAFAKVLHHAQFSGGIVEVHDCFKPEKAGRWPHSDDLNGLTLREALNRIVADDPRYKWQIDDTAIDLIPRRGVPPLLDIHLTHFQLRAEDVAMAIEATLFTEPTVEKALHELNLKKEDRLKVYIGSAPPPMGKPLDLIDASILHILNAVASNHRFPAVWHYAESVGNCEHTYYLEWLVR